MQAWGVAHAVPGGVAVGLSFSTGHGMSASRQEATAVSGTGALQHLSVGANTTSCSQIAVFGRLLPLYQKLQKFEFFTRIIQYDLLYYVVCVRGKADRHGFRTP